MSRASASRRALTRLTGRALNMRQPRGVMDPRCSDSADALQIGPTLERLLNSSAYATVDAVSGQARPRKKAAAVRERRHGHVDPCRQA